MPRKNRTKQKTRRIRRASEMLKPGVAFGELKREDPISDLRRTINSILNFKAKPASPGEIYIASRNLSANLKRFYKKYGIMPLVEHTRTVLDVAKNFRIDPQYKAAVFYAMGLRWNLLSSYETYPYIDQEIYDNLVIESGLLGGRTFTVEEYRTMAYMNMVAFMGDESRWKVEALDSDKLTRILYERSHLPKWNGVGVFVPGILGDGRGIIISTKTIGVYMFYKYLENGDDYVDDDVMARLVYFIMLKSYRDSSIEALGSAYYNVEMSRTTNFYEGDMLDVIRATIKLAKQFSGSERVAIWPILVQMGSIMIEDLFDGTAINMVDMYNTFRNLVKDNEFDMTLFFGGRVPIDILLTDEPWKGVDLTEIEAKAITQPLEAYTKYPAVVHVFRDEYGALEEAIVSILNRSLPHIYSLDNLISTSIAILVAIHSPYSIIKVNKESLEIAQYVYTLGVAFKEAIDTQTGVRVNLPFDAIKASPHFSWWISQDEIQKLKIKPVVLDKDYKEDYERALNNNDYYKLLYYSLLMGVPKNQFERLKSLFIIRSSNKLMKIASTVLVRLRGARPVEI